MSQHIAGKRATRPQGIRAVAVACLFVSLLAGCRAHFEKRIIRPIIDKVLVALGPIDEPVLVAIWPPTVTGVELLGVALTTKKCQAAIQRELELALFSVCSKERYASKLKPVPLSLAKMCDQFAAKMLLENWQTSDFVYDGVKRPEIVIQATIAFRPKSVDGSILALRASTMEPMAASSCKGIPINRRQIERFCKLRLEADEGHPSGSPVGWQLSLEAQRKLREGDYARDLSDPHTALDDYKEAHQIAGNHPAILLSLAYLYGFERRLLNTAEAERLYQQVIEGTDAAKPHLRVKAMINLSVLCQKRGKADEAAKLLHEARLLEPGNICLLLNLAVLARSRDDDVECERLLREAIRRSRDASHHLLARALHGWGMALHRLGKTAEGIEALREAAGDPNNPDVTRAWFDLAWLYHEDGQYDRAVKELRELHEKCPRDNRVMVMLGVAYTNKQEYDQAIRWLKKAIQVDSTAPEPYLKLGFVLCYKGNSDAADRALGEYRRRLLPGEERSPEAAELELLIEEYRTRDAQTTAPSG